MNIDNFLDHQNVCDEVVYVDTIECLIQEEWFRFLEALSKTKNIIIHVLNIATAIYIYN